jgi:hypothetical protein
MSHGGCWIRLRRERDHRVSYSGGVVKTIRSADRRFRCDVRRAMERLQRQAGSSMDRTSVYSIGNE